MESDELVMGDLHSPDNSMDSTVPTSAPAERMADCNFLGEPTDLEGSDVDLTLKMRADVVNNGASGW